MSNKISQLLQKLDSSGRARIARYGSSICLPQNVDKSRTRRRSHGGALSKMCLAYKIIVTCLGLFEEAGRSSTCVRLAIGCAGPGAERREQSVMGIKNTRTGSRGH